MNRDEIEARLIAKAQADGAFRERLVANPSGAIADALGEDVPDGVEVVVLQEEPGKFYLVLPADASELSDAELDAVSGGKVDKNSKKPKK